LQEQPLPSENLERIQIIMEKTPHEIYSPHQIRQARETDIIDFLERKEGFTFKKTGNSWKCIEHDSLVITNDRRGWHWNSKGISGSSAIDWYEKIHNLKFHESLAQIIGAGDVIRSNYTASPALIPHAREKSRVFSLPESAPDNRRVYAYLTKTRGIDTSIVNQLITDKQLYQDIRGNCVFVGLDSNNNARYAGIRGTLTDKQFLGEVAGSDKRYSFSMSSQSKVAKNFERLYIFESPIEAMSHASIVNQYVGSNKAFTLHNRLSLGGTTDIALVQYLQDNPHINQLVFCLNNDVAGRTATPEMCAKFSEQGYAVRNNPPIMSDYNEDLLTEYTQKQEIIGSIR
jgi:hypothetical protein